MPDGIGSLRFLKYEFLVRMRETINMLDNVWFTVEAFSSMHVTTVPWDAAYTLPASGTSAPVTSSAMQYAWFVSAAV